MNENEKNYDQWIVDIDAMLADLDLELIVSETESNRKCYCCGREIHNDEFIEIGSMTICNDCKDEHVYECECCGDLILDDDCTIVNDAVFCPDCIDRYFVTCADCGELVRRRDAWEIASGEYVCEWCRENDYCYCADCGELYHIDDLEWVDCREEYYCQSCYEDRRNKAIHDYYYKPAPIFYGGSEWDNLLFMGVELEVDNGGEYDDHAEILRDTMNTCNEHIYIKHDGSLNDGFEIVSHPATLDYHLNKMRWLRLMEKAVAMEYKSHDTETCGLHVHVSRRSLGDTYDERENTIAKIVYFIENNWDYIVKFTRRKSDNLRRWAGCYGIENTIENTYDKAKRDYNRYKCLNLLNENTIEFRVFRGTLKYETFVATLQFVNDLCNICMRLNMAVVESLEWSKFVSMLPAEHVELLEYLKKRNLY